MTVVGTGGIGKTALAAPFAERFGWRFDGGVIGFSLADLPGLAPESFFLALLERVAGPQAAARLADRPAERDRRGVDGGGAGAAAAAAAGQLRERPAALEEGAGRRGSRPAAADAPPAAPET